MTSVGAIIMCLFAAIWWAIGAHASRSGSVVLYGMGFLITAVIVVAASRSHAQPTTPEEESRVGRLVGIASGVEGVLILIAVNVLRNIGMSAFVAPVVAIIIGLHFFPLARWLPARLYYGTAAALIAIGAVGWVLNDAHRRLLFVCFGSAAVLWFTATATLITIRSKRVTSRQHTR
jgi:hypothetical protein